MILMLCIYGYPNKLYINYCHHFIIIVYMCELKYCDVEITSFWDYGRPLVNRMAFQHLGRIIMATDDDCPNVVANISKARKKWARMSIILRW